VLFVVALVPRSVDLDQHATADEDLTLIRSANVALALEGRDWWGTYQIGHPEVTVQLLVALGLGADALRPYAGDFLGPDARGAARVPGYFDTLVQARHLLTPIHAGLVVVAALLAWRLWGPMAGLLTGLLLALEPFMVAHGRILRTDVLLAELLLVAVLAALAFWSGRAGAWALALCTIATSLALLTKTPALALLGAVPAAALAGVLQRRSRLAPLPDTDQARERAGSPSHTVEGEDRGARSRDCSNPLRISSGPAGMGWLCDGAALAIWLVGSAALVVALWPAMWARPLRAIERMAVYTQEKGGSPMDAGSFLLGVPVADPGPLYYAVALPLRLSPLLLAGLLAWVLLRAPGARRGVGLVLLVGLGLAAVLALLPKKADRYILPAVPFLAVVAAVGIAALAERWKRPGAAAALGLVAAVEAALLVAVWPYPLAAYNPLLGGGPTATESISVGWGEGLDQLAPALNARPDGGDLTVSTPYPEVLQSQIAGRAVDLDEYDIAEYAVRYIAASQRHLTSSALDAVLADREPISRVTIAGIPYAEVYELDRPSFVGDLEVGRLDVSPSLTTRRGWVTVRLALGPANTDGRLSGPGQSPSVASLDVEAVLLNSARTDDVEARVTRSVLPDGSPVELKLRAPDGLGRYVVGLRVRDPASGAQLAVASWPVGAPRYPDSLVFPSLSVRVQ
jgi:hypothetical protein